MTDKIRLVAVNLLVFTAGIIALELVFGSWLRASPLKDSLIPRDILLVRPQNYYPSSEDVIYRRDAWGLRGAYPSADRIDILTVGGSTTDQRYITEGKTWQDVLRNKFLESGREVYVVNAGVDGQSTLGHLWNFEAWFPNIPGLKPRYFLFYVGHNDVFLKQSAGWADRPDQLSFKQQIARKSALYGAFRTLRGMFFADRSALSHRHVDFSRLEMTDEGLQDGWPERLKDALSAYEARLRRLIREARRYGARSIFVTQTRRTFKTTEAGVVGVASKMQYGGLEVNGVDHYRIFRLFNEATMRVCREEGEICLDLAENLLFEDTDFYDWAHTTPEGAEKTGGFLYRHLDRFFPAAREPVTQD